MNNLTQKLGFWHFDDDLMVFSDGSLGMGFRLEGHDISCLPANEINDFVRRIENMLISTQEGLRLQLFYRLTPNVQEVLEKHAEISSDMTGAYQNVREARLKFIAKNQTEGSYFVPEIYFFIRSQAYQLKKRKLFDKKEKYETIGEQEYEQHREKFLRSVRQVESSLLAANLSPLGLPKEKWFQLLFEYLNLSRTERIGAPSSESSENTETLNERLCLTDLFVEKDGLKIGDYWFRVITLKLLPEGHTHASMIDAFTKLPFHYWISQNIHILSQENERSKLQLHRRIAHSMAAGSKNVSDLESESKVGHLESLLNEMLEGSEKFISSDFNVMIWDKDKQELEDKTDEVLKAFRGLNQSEGLIETLPAIDAFIKAAPGTCEGLRHKKMKTSNVSHLMPLYSFWKGNDRPVCLFSNREGSPFAIDFFAKSLPAWNGIIFGQTGSGKSFTVSQLMLQFYGQTPRPRIIWIDNGASSKRLIEALEGEFLDLKLDAGHCLNMFDLKPGDTEPTPEKIRLILAILELILKEDDRKSLPKREKALLEESVYRTYQNHKGQIPTLSDLREVLTNHPMQEMKRFADILYSWTGQTAYGQMLDGQSTVRLSKDLVTIEVQSLNQQSELKDVMLLLLTSYIQDMASTDFERPYLLIVDEAERLFQTELAKQFVITCYRTWRKFNSAIWCLSQNYRDFLADKNLAASLLPNTTSVVILRQRKIDWKDFQETFDFNEAQVEAIKSLQIVKGQYSEFYYLQDERQGIVRLTPEPLSYWICTSDGNEKAKILELQSQNPNLSTLEVLKQLAFPKTTKTTNQEES